MAINNPAIHNYKPFYIAGNSDSSTVKDTLADFGLIAKTNPYPALPKPKEPYKNDWHDGHGDDEEIGDSLYMESFEFKVEYYVRAIGSTAVTDVRGAIDSFFAFIKSNFVRYYDSFTGIGYKDVRYAGYEEQMFHVTTNGDGNNVARCVFTVTFKVNDPVTRMKIVTVGGQKRIRAI